MDEVHCLHWHGKYSMADVMDMTGRERTALMDRAVASMKEEVEAIEKATKGS